MSSDLSSLFQMVTRTKKIFVGGLSAQSTLEDVKNYFEQFGKVRKTRKNFPNWPRRISVVFQTINPDPFMSC